MSFPTLDALRESLARPTTKARSPEYIAKMMHAVPKATVVDRAAFILERVTGKRVLEFGASGPMHEAIVKAAANYWGVDRNRHEGVVVRDGAQLAYHVGAFDLDDVSQMVLPTCWVPDDFTGSPLVSQEQPDVIVCGEVVEHLSNPGWFLTRLKRQYAGVPVIVTAPNAFSEIAAAHLEHGTENVNIDHVAWYSYRTLRTLFERAGYVIEAFHWYGGEPYTAEGLVMVAR